MRISDWSSDVCSSDLRAVAAVVRAGYNSALSHPRESHSPASGDQEGLQHSGCQENSEEGRQGGQEARRQEARREIRRQQVQRQAGRRQEGCRKEGRARQGRGEEGRSEEHTSELQSLMRI